MIMHADKHNTSVLKPSCNYVMFQHSVLVERKEQGVEWPQDQRVRCGGVGCLTLQNFFLILW